MGYTTTFDGRFELNKPLTAELSAYLFQFSKTRRMQRDASKTILRPDPLREAIGLGVGLEGSYFVGEGGFYGQDRSNDLLDYNCPPKGQPGLWCQWVPTEDGMGIEWDGGEKFYDYVEWLRYLIRHFLAPDGYVLNGKVNWCGEESSDLGLIVVKDNEVSTKIGRVVYE